MDKKPDERYVRWLEEYHRDSMSWEEYNNKGADALLLIVCTVGLFVPGGWAYGVALAAHYLSFRCGSIANREAGTWSRYEVLAEDGDADYSEELKSLMRKADAYGVATRALNAIAVAAMAVGMFHSLLQ